MSIDADLESITSYIGISSPVKDYDLFHSSISPSSIFVATNEIISRFSKDLQDAISNHQNEHCFTQHLYVFNYNMAYDKYYSRLDISVSLCCLKDHFFNKRTIYSHSDTKLQCL
jgi:hypothetical protein